MMCRVAGGILFAIDSLRVGKDLTVIIMCITMLFPIVGCIFFLPVFCCSTFHVSETSQLCFYRASIVLLSCFY